MALAGKQARHLRLRDILDEEGNPTGDAERRPVTVLIHEVHVVVRAGNTRIIAIIEAPNGDLEIAGIEDLRLIQP